MGAHRRRTGGTPQLVAIHVPRVAPGRHRADRLTWWAQAVTSGVIIAGTLSALGLI